MPHQDEQMENEYVKLGLCSDEAAGRMEGEESCSEGRRSGCRTLQPLFAQRSRLPEDKGLDFSTVHCCTSPSPTVITSSNIARGPLKTSKHSNSDSGYGQSRDHSPHDPILTPLKPTELMSRSARIMIPSQLQTRLGSG